MEMEYFFVSGLAGVIGAFCLYKKINSLIEKTPRQDLMLRISIYPNSVSFYHLIICWVAYAIFLAKGDYFLIFGITVFLFVTGSFADLYDGKIARILEIFEGKWLDPLIDKLITLPAFYYLYLVGMINFTEFVLITAIEITGQFVVRPILTKLGINIEAKKFGKYKTFCQNFYITTAMFTLNGVPLDFIIIPEDHFLNVAIGLVKQMKED